jgi:hypothetical protein
VKKWHIIILFLLLQILLALALGYIAETNDFFSSGKWRDDELALFFFILIPCLIIPCALLTALVVQFTGSRFYKSAIWRSFLATLLFWFSLPVLYLTIINLISQREETLKHKAQTLEDIKNRRNGSTMFLAEQIAWLWISEIDRYKWNESTASCEVVLKNGDKFSFYTKVRHDTVNIKYQLSHVAPLSDTVFWVNKTYNIAKFFLSEDATSKAESMIENKLYNYMNIESNFGITLPDKDIIFYSIAEKQQYPEYLIKVMPRHLRIFEKDLYY